MGWGHRVLHTGPRSAAKFCARIRATEIGGLGRERQDDGRDRGRTPGGCSASLHGTSPGALRFYSPHTPSSLHATHCLFCLPGAFMQSLRRKLSDKKSSSNFSANVRVVQLSRRSNKLRSSDGAAKTSRGERDDPAQASASLPAAADSAPNDSRRSCRKPQRYGLG